MENLEKLKITDDSKVTEKNEKISHALHSHHQQQDEENSCQCGHDHETPVKNSYEMAHHLQDHDHHHHHHHHECGDASCGSGGEMKYIFRANKFIDKTQFEIKDDELNFNGIKYIQYENETQMPLIMNLITKDLSEPYSIYTYRYFIHNWPYLCFIAMEEEECVGAIVCKLDRYKDSMRGYIAMLDVKAECRRKQIGSNLVSLAIKRMIQHNADEIVLETEVTNKAALKLYENLGFVKDKRLFRYYLNGVEAFRLKLWLK